ncbi:hypothetical protein P170DRAFT_240868 [Aspergillus steynii IBT 23096]|uniref:Methyltransferase domain-containing protein n=1 Tax=Aspergillus steynii IBT 23096 TaxID=1392250 RepID=A0A2I2G3H6_9EURO|nr:uncharacterized protein P170DRAFT_240868 [Aspergillus steynii IBT 23096]PLB47431.1 hypothetical protein P170DRAFT_240868 [Aspergillus steynii IBT 23096]
MILFPRFHLFEIGDQPWCPAWLIAYIQSYLTRVWNLHIPPFSKTSPAGVAADIIIENLPDPSSFTFVDLCSGAGGPSSTIESILHAQSKVQGKRSPRFILTDLHPHLTEWTAVAKRQENVDYVSESVDATKCRRIDPGNRKECRMFNLCFHHFDDEPAKAVLRSAVESGDSFIIFELAQRNFTSLLNIPVMILFPFFHTITRYWKSPLHLYFTYLVPLLSFAVSFDGLISTMRCRTPEEIQTLLHQPDLDISGWEFKSGSRMVFWPFVNIYWYVGVKR